MPKKRRQTAAEAKAMIQRAAAAGKIEFAPQTKTDAMGQWVGRVLEILGHPEALVTDMSSVGDFLSCTKTAKERRAELQKLSEQFGFPVKSGDTIVRLAVQLRDRASQRLH